MSFGTDTASGGTPMLAVLDCSLPSENACGATRNSRTTSDPTTSVAARNATAATHSPLKRSREPVANMTASLDSVKTLRSFDGAGLVERTKREYGEQQRRGGARGARGSRRL